MEFWIDVGGTFTDCIARMDDGRLMRHKLLSSGVTKGTIGDGSDATTVLDTSRVADPNGFWNGYVFQLLDQDGRPAAGSRVCHFARDQGALRLETPLPHMPRAGQAYELTSGEEAPITGIRYLLGLGLGDPVPAVTVRLGTTRGTNALITRQGAKTALVTTQGFADVLRIGYQNRPRLFDLSVCKRASLFTRVTEIEERITFDGTVLQRPDPAVVRTKLAALRQSGIESLAVCLLNAYAHPSHEQLVGRIAREVGFDEISLSSEIVPLIKIVARGDTTVMNAYLNPVLRLYIMRLRRALGNGRLQLLTSAGGLVDADHFVGKDSILSGPAGGVVGFSHVAQSAGFSRAIGFDMGGTSTDVSRFDGQYDLEYETEKSGVRVVAPMMAIETVAAGGGSICRFDGVKLAVGPNSAGADPGPACYGRGGPLTVTDLNLFQGKILADHFPFPLNCTAVESRLQRMCHDIAAATNVDYTLHQLAAGLLHVANTNMVKAIRSISIAKGCDPRDYVLVAFGGAAGQHACAVARELGITQVLTHPDSGILSAYGIGQAQLVRHGAVGIYQPYTEQLIAELDDSFQRLANELRTQLLADGADTNLIDVHRSIDLRYRGLDACLTIAEPENGTYADCYAAEHQRIHGYVQPERPLEIVAIRVQVVGRSVPAPRSSRPIRRRDTAPKETRTIWFDNASRPSGIYTRATLRPGDRIPGPAVICEPTSTTLVDPGWTAEVLAHEELLLTFQGKPDRPAIAPLPAENRADPILLEVFNHQFAGIAEQMGITLRGTSVSVNVKERLDFSCALFTSDGDLVVNAPHIPVHLGAMSETVRAILAENPTIRPGDVFVTNDPYRGGAHLPDVTVVTPVHAEETHQLLFFTASRAHHAEIGGIVPGSMPPFSTNLAEEGVLITNFTLVEAGRPRWDALRNVLQSGPYPSRAVEDNLADVAAQLAANQRGTIELRKMINHYSLPVVTAYMRHIQTAAEQKMRAALDRLSDGRHEFTDYMDDGSPITVAVTISGDQTTIDFTGTSPVVGGNLNANRAIVTAAVMYCLRCLIAEDIPLNQGVLAPVRIVLPPCMLNPPRGDRPETCAAVVGGNVETSQRVVDVILGALGLAAASQGTMNNIMFGDATFGYYETICGGAGATPGSNGADAVHTHMTNTRLTDPEVMERRYPVRVHEFSIRRGSGGTGWRQGGDGVIRQIEFLTDLNLSILSQRRGPYPPFGIFGGQPGELGRNRLVHADGSIQVLGGLVQQVVHAGDRLIIETPGGGGVGNH